VARGGGGWPWREAAVAGRGTRWPWLAVARGGEHRRKATAELGSRRGCSGERPDLGQMRVVRSTKHTHSV
jgi:hypothetical protein